MAAPTITGIAPGTGPAAGGTTITITGAGLTGTTTVKFGAVSASAVTVLSDTTIQAVAPAGTGTVSVTVTTPGGTSNALYYVYGSVSTSTELQSAPNPSDIGEVISLTATVDAASGTPTGTVSFLDGSTILGSVTLSGGVATFTTSTLSVGSHSLTATYSGNSSFSGSTSPVVVQTVNPPLAAIPVKTVVHALGAILVAIGEFLLSW